MINYSDVKKNLKKNINLILSSVIVKDIMIPRSEVILLNTNSSLSDIINIINTHGYSRYPVYDNHVDNIIGIAHAKDILKFFNQNQSSFCLKKVLRKPLFIPENKKANELLAEFKKEKIHQAIVVDEYGVFLGIVSLEDILEILVGDIQDEYDTKTEDDIVQLSQKEFLVVPKITLDNFNNYFNTKLHSKNFDTLGGYIIEHLGYVPKKGEILEYNNLTFVIYEISGSKITKILVKRN